MIWKSKFSNKKDLGYPSINIDFVVSFDNQPVVNHFYKQLKPRNLKNKQQATICRPYRLRDMEFLLKELDLLKIWRMHFSSLSVIFGNSWKHDTYLVLALRGWFRRMFLYSLTSLFPDAVALHLMITIGMQKLLKST